MHWQPGEVRCEVVAQTGVENFAPSHQTLAVQSVEELIPRQDLFCPHAGCKQNAPGPEFT